MNQDQPKVSRIVVIVSWVLLVASIVVAVIINIILFGRIPLPPM